MATCESCYGCSVSKRDCKKQPAGACARFVATTPAGPSRPFGAGSPGTAAELRPGSAAGARNEHEQNHLIIRKRQLASSM